VGIAHIWAPGTRPASPVRDDRREPAAAAGIIGPGRSSHFFPHDDIHAVAGADGAWRFEHMDGTPY